MAECSEFLKEFNQTIYLSKSRRESLKVSRDALRQKIRDYFKENKSDELSPRFCGQGSFMMNTIINPILKIDESGAKLVEYDIDDGVYFVAKDETDQKAIATYHQWIYDAVKDHTDKGAIKKTTCVRVMFADGHHIDLPIYYKVENEAPELAHKSKGWIVSDPREFSNWFKEKAASDQQLRRVVRYLKAWINQRNNERSDIKMPSGLIMTILATNNIAYNEREDISLKKTLCNIKSKLEKEFKCLRPTIPKDEDLFEGYSETRKKHFMDSLDAFCTSASQAIEEENQKEACLKWKKHLGDRYSCGNAKDEICDAQKFSSPDVIKRNASSAQNWS